MDSSTISQEKLSVIPNEPLKILKSPKVFLYFCGAAGNKGYYNHVARLQGMRQLGFSVLVIDYRGFGSSLRLPVLFIHGTADSVVPSYMSQQLYNAAPEPKQILLIPGAEHFRIYQPGSNSYLQAIQKFIDKM
ncbi:hypothetical protein A6770_16260 [Nostoc minutum NIES-26]|uniref:Serine aminopeptidase S33 domain-containing protein n=1 Tax=Nostoc minutum NIES-26 TaxID=1844469 RepID=A0A367RFQ3_9NOSO|nr:hypothetical protein A6770_16260 [Nostoc minutum NIES-26]